jgi:hypothetical protein
VGGPQTQKEKSIMITYEDLQKLTRTELVALRGEIDKQIDHQFYLERENAVRDFQDAFNRLTELHMYVMTKWPLKANQTIDVNDVSIEMLG